MHHEKAQAKAKGKIVIRTARYAFSVRVRTKLRDEMNNPKISLKIPSGISR